MVEVISKKFGPDVKTIMQERLKAIPAPHQYNLISTSDMMSKNTIKRGDENNMIPLNTNPFV